MNESIYAVLHNTRKQAYIGKTSSTVQQRWAQHLASAAAGEDKLLFEELRHAPNEWDIIECETSSTASEQHWITVFRAEGYSLLNVAAGNRKPAKKRDGKAEALNRQGLAGALPRWEQPKGDPIAMEAMRLAELQRVRDYVKNYLGDEPIPESYAAQQLRQLRERSATSGRQGLIRNK